MNTTKLLTWKERTTFEKILVASGFVISITVMVLAILKLFGVTENNNRLLGPLLGLFMLIQALQYAKYNKFIFSLV